MSIGMVGIGSYLPDVVETNDDIEMTSGYDRAAKKGRSLDEWALAHHGGRERRRAAPGQATSDLATAAAGAALRDAGMTVADVDLLVVATVTSDHRLPPTAAVVQSNLGMTGKFLQLDSACTGFVDGILTARALLDNGSYRRALVVCADRSSTYLDRADWLTRSVFGDGAAAVVLDRVPDGYGFEHLVSMSEGEIGHYVRILAGGSREVDSDPSGLDPGFLRTDFGDVHKWGVPRLVDAATHVLKNAGIGVDDVTWVVPHQASVRMVTEATEMLGVDPERVVLTYARYGNTVGASLPMALDEAYREGRFAEGDVLLLAAVGAGMAWGGGLYRWPPRAGA